MANTGTTGFLEVTNSNIFIPYATASNYDIAFRTDQIQQKMFLGNGSNASAMPGIILSSNNIGVGNALFTPGISNRMWDFAGTISDTSLKPGVIGSSYRTGSNISISTLTPFSNINTEGSFYFQGITGNYFTLPQPTTTSLTDMTIEAWIYQTSNPIIADANRPYLIGNINTLNNTNYWSFGITPSNQIGFNGYSGGAPKNIIGSTISNNTWNHIAVCYSVVGNSLQLFLNGAVQTLTISGTGMTGNGTTTAGFPTGLSNNSAAPLTIGQYSNTSLNAYVTNLRWVNSILYTASFTPSIYPLQTYSNTTQLLLRAPLYNPIEYINNIQTYDSLRAHCLPADAMIYADCYGTSLPNLSGQYTPVFDSNITKSIVFNSANSNFLSFPSQAFNIATKGFTVLCKILTTSNYSGSIFNCSNAANNLISLYQTSGVNNGFLMFNGSTQVGNAFINGPTSLNTINTVVCRYDPYTNLGTVTTFINASNVASSNNWNSSIGSDRVQTSITIGNYVGPPWFKGNIYNLAVYNRALTDKEIIDASAALMVTPTLPNQSTIELGSVSGKPALTVKNDGTIQVAGPINANNNQSYAPIDYGVSNFTIPGFIYGNVPAVSTSPFNSTNGGSMYITTNNYINITNPIFQTSWWLNGGFTCEAWVNYPSFTTVATGLVPMTMGNINTSGSTNFWSFGANQSSNLSYFYYSSSAAVYITGSNLMQPNNWYHIAVSYDLTTIRIFQNGILQNSAALSGTPNTITLSNFGIGGQQNSTTVGNAYITNTRVVYGSALYTANFTPPTGPLEPASSGTTAFLMRVPQNPGRVLIPKIGGTTQVQVYPPTALTGNLTNVNNSGYGVGYYSVTNSSELSNGFIGYLAFVYSGTNRWAPANSTYSLVSPYDYIGNVSTIDASGNSYNGEWLQIKVPEPIVINSYSFSSLATDIINTFYLLGSVDGIIWNNLDYNTAAAVGATPVLFVLNANSKSYQYYRFVITQAGGQTTTSLYNCKLFGTQESINITPDGQVGIGITQPKQSLEVAGNAMFYGNISANNMGMFRNRIINGDMSINQRGLSSSNIGTGTHTPYLMDRFGLLQNVTTGGITLSNVNLISSDTPYQYGFTNSFRITASTACSSYSYILPKTAIEGYNMTIFNWQTTYGSPITISFWFRAMIIGSYSVCMRNANAGGYKAYNTLFTYNTAPDWQYITVTIPPPPSTYGWNNNTNLLAIEIFLAGCFPASTSTSGVWVGTGACSAIGFTDWVTTLNNYVELTGVQVEKGTIATPFEFRPYAIELQLCQRYYYRTTGTTIFAFFGNGYGASTTAAEILLQIPSMMRDSTPGINLGPSTGSFGLLSSVGNPVLTGYNWLDMSTNCGRLSVTFNTVAGLTGTGVALISQGVITYIEFLADV